MLILISFVNGFVIITEDIQIHRMLILISSAVYTSPPRLLNSNTSNVNLNQKYLILLNGYVFYSNTSNVNLNRLLKCAVITSQRDSNTSNVNLNPGCHTFNTASHCIFKYIEC